MGDTWITDIRHFLDDTGEIPEVLPNPAVNLVHFLISIVSWVSLFAPNCQRVTNVFCRRSPKRKSCKGQIHAQLDSETSQIQWFCPLCGDQGIISGWEGTLADRRVPEE